MVAARDVDLVGLAAMLHRSYDWTQANWRTLAAAEGLPPPFIGAGRGERPWWRRTAVDAWIEARSGAQTAPSASVSLPQRGLAAPPSPANDPAPRPIDPGDAVARLLAAAGG